MPVQLFLMFLLCFGFFGCKEHVSGDGLLTEPQRLSRRENPTEEAPRSALLPPGHVLVLRSSVKNLNGCADGQREGFVDIEVYPRIAGCSGAWTVPGILGFHPGLAPACPDVKTHDTNIRMCGGTGDDKPDSSGDGCTVADLCAEGWHVCTGSVEVAELAPAGCAAATRPGDPLLLFAIRQSSTGCVSCASGNSTGSQCQAHTCTVGCAQSAAISNDIFGCGNFGVPVSNALCGPINRFSNDKCNGLTNSPWNCDLPGSEDDNGLCEAYTLTKTRPSHGGVLCCADSAFREGAAER